MMAKITDLFDPKCYELAEHFALGESFTDGELSDLAREIQGAVEDWFSARNAEDIHE